MLQAQEHHHPLLVLPRPGGRPQGLPSAAIAGPSEAAMTSLFGALLPPASHLTTPHGRAAYYLYPPTTTTTTTPSPTTATPIRILLVHGVQTPALGLHPLASALRAHFPTAHIAAFDHWGHGLSDTPQEPHTPDLFYRLIDAVLGELGWSSAHLVGYSFGGATVAGYAAAAAAANKKVVESVVLVAPAGLLRSDVFGDEVKQRYLVERQQDDEQRESEARDWIVNFLEGGGPLVIPPDWEERVARDEVVAEAVRDWQMRAHRGHAASVVAIFRDGGCLDNHAVFAQVAATGPDCLVVLGETDDFCRVDDLEKVGLRNVVVVPQVGHAVVRQKAEDVAGHIGEFWRGLGVR